MPVCTENIPGVCEIKDKQNIFTGDEKNEVAREIQASNRRKMMRKALFVRGKRGLILLAELRFTI